MQVLVASHGNMLIFASECGSPLRATTDLGVVGLLAAGALTRGLKTKHVSRSMGSRSASDSEA